MGRPRKFDEGDAVKAVTAQFRKFGYCHTSVDDLQAVTRLGRASLYRTFGDKHALFARVYDEYCANMLAAMTELLRDRGDGMASRCLVDYVTRTIRHVVADSENGGCFIAKESAELAATDTYVAERTRTTYRSALDLLTACVVRAQREGDLRSDVDPAAVAASLLATTRGAEGLRKGGVDRETLEAVAERAVSTLPWA